MSAPEVELDFRSVPDDAWYGVQVIFHGEKLTVKFCDFPENCDEVFEASKFENLEELKEFEGRFRPASIQLQDDECSKVVEGLHVCASHAFSDVDNRFYDAVVENVMHKRHYFAKGEEECSCSFILLWQHGPLVGQMTEKKVENICIVRPNVKHDRNVASFLEIAKEKIGKKCAMRSVSQIHPSEGLPLFFKDPTRLSRSCAPGRVDHISEANNQDIDFGGADNYSILLENLEKDLSPSKIFWFIHQQTSIVSESYVFPGLATELYARGVIMLSTPEDLLVLCEFLNNPDHIIISSRGRPWVVARKFSRIWNNMLAQNGTSMLKQKKLQKGNTEISHELKLAYAGTEEYEKAKELRDLLVEFRLHHERLHKRLAVEEKNIWLVQSNVKLDRNVSSSERAKEKIIKKCAMLSVSRFLPSEGWIDNINEADGQNIDFGGVDSCLILLENLEKDLSPSKISKFIHRQTSIVSKSYVFPSLETELYARGVIVLNTREDVLVLCEFLNNPDQIIVSCRGRPWVVAARNFSRNWNNVLAPNETSIFKQKKPSNDNTEITQDLKLAYSGTDEYEKAKELRDLLMEFNLHHKRLHKRLAIEEKKILQPTVAAAAV